MVAPVASSYSVSAGQPIYAGRLRSGFVAGAVLAAMVAGGVMAAPVSAFGAGATLRPSVAGGALDVNLNARISFWGQSNAVGDALRSGVLAAPLSSDAELADYDDGTLPFTRVMFWNGTAYAMLVPGSNSGTTNLGPEFGIAVEWMRRTASGILYLDKNAVGGTSITAFEPDQSRWNTGISQKASQDAWLSSNGVTIPTSRTFWFWSQAEADSANDQAWYQPRMQAIVDALPATGIMPGKGILTDIPVGSTRYNAGISAAKAAVAATTGGSVVVQLEPAFFESDNLHLNARSQVQRSYNAFGFYFDVTPSTV